MASPLKLKNNANPLAPKAKIENNWRVLIVDDEPEVHAVTKLILNKLVFKDRKLTLLSAYSAAEAQELLRREKNIAVILLDVVMETDDAGLQLVKFIREDLKNTATRIILRTGQPGQAPEDRVIVDYDINDYKAKSELTAQKLTTSIIATLRSYETIMSLEKTRQGLEKILESTATLFQVGSLKTFASGVLTQLSAFLGCQPNGILCVQFDAQKDINNQPICHDLQIMAATGEFSHCNECTLNEPRCDEQVMIVDLIHKAIETQHNQLSDDYTVIFLDIGEANGIAALLHCDNSQTDEADRKLLEVFASKISLALANAITYQKMISAETAATSDFLTNLNNRRQLLRLGIPLIASAQRTNSPLALAMIDIDFFKAINDRLGHDAGDLALQVMGNMLKERFRTSDVIARFGGEEFCVICTDIEAEEAIALFDSFRIAISKETIMFGNECIKMTISIGLTTRRLDNIDNMISAADALLYQAKHNGRNQVVHDAL
jgi:diguanylate cyclase (GGDEF)-like protein